MCRRACGWTVRTCAAARAGGCGAGLTNCTDAGYGCGGCRPGSGGEGDGEGGGGGGASSFFFSAGAVKTGITHFELAHRTL